MQLTQDFRNAELSQKLLRAIENITTQPWAIMEICGGQTHAILQYGIDELLPEQIELIHGPGCPVCVTPLEMVDKALAIASLPDVIFTTFGDMLRVPGSEHDLFSVRGKGGQVRIVYSPMDAVKVAQANPEKQVVFFAIGFETTVPANAACVLQAQSLGLKNFSILTSQVMVPPAIHAILSSPQNRVQGFLAAGHVCTVMGYWQYVPIAEQYQVPITVTGFEPVDLLNGIYRTIQALEEKRFTVQNAYNRAVTFEGNRQAQELMNRVFEPRDQNWRGIGMIPQSGLGLRAEFSEFDAERRFPIGHIQTRESERCIAGLILQGLKKPFECAAFGDPCTPQNPLGATMVSSEGACAAYYRYHRHSGKETSHA